MEPERHLQALWLSSCAPDGSTNGTVGAEMYLSRISAVLIAIGIVIFLQGFAVVRALLFPLALIVLVITALLCFGVRTSSSANAVIVMITASTAPPLES